MSVLNMICGDISSNPCVVGKRVYIKMFFFYYYYYFSMKIYAADTHWKLMSQRDASSKYNFQKHLACKQEVINKNCLL